MTAGQIEYVRAMSGDDTATYEVSDVLMQTFFDDTRVAEDLDKTVVFVMRVRVGKAARLVNETNEAQVQKSLSQKFDHLKELLATWETRTGMGGGVIGTGVIDQQLDTSLSGSEYAAYSSWYWWSQ
jgi:hypothetical protein